MIKEGRQIVDMRWTTVMVPSRNQHPSPTAETNLMIMEPEKRLQIRTAYVSDHNGKHEYYSVSDWEDVRTEGGHDE